jgi:hypothetical protein
VSQERRTRRRLGVRSAPNMSSPAQSRRAEMPFMSKMRSMIILGLLAVFALSAATAATASAASPEWWVAKEAIKTAETISEKTNVIRHFSISTSTSSIECSELAVKKGFIKNKEENSAEAFVFKGCTATVGKTKCSVDDAVTKIAGTIETKPIAFKLENPAKEKEDNKINFKPKKGEEFATIEDSCLEGSKEILSGSMVCAYPSVETEADEHRLNFNETSGSEIELGHEKAKFTGEVGITLTSAKLWSVKFS